MFDKGTANRHMAAHGFMTLPHCRIDAADSEQTAAAGIAAFFTQHAISKAVVKPSNGGSSLGVATVTDAAGALAKARQIFADGHGEAALIEPFCTGQEFTVVTLANESGEPVALIPTEISLSGGEIFSFRHKYLPTCHVEYHCPPRFTDATVVAIQQAAEALFRFFGMRDFARLDGWLLTEGSVVFSDFNPISGMEQNSFLFIQGSRVGLTHAETLRQVVISAARRHKLDASVAPALKDADAAPVRVLFGGTTAERQVSLMSGTNVWLKLRQAVGLQPEPYLLTADQQVWHLPYAYTLNHTVEEIVAHCAEAPAIAAKLERLVPPIRQRLGLPPLSSAAALPAPPELRYLLPRGSIR